MSIARHSCTCSEQKPTVSGDLLSAHEVFLALLKIKVNGIAIVPEEHASAEDRLALAIFPHASMLNHACKPNVDFQFSGRKLKVTAREDILQGQALRHCYGPQVIDFHTSRAMLFRGEAGI